MSLFGLANFVLNHPLSRGRKFANLVRLARWQIGARLVPGPVAAQFVNGAMILARPGMAGATGNVYVGLHEFEDMSFVLHFLRPEDLLVDVGANIGSYSILAASGIGSRAIAFEPDGTAFDWLTRNIRLNGVGHLVEAHRQAVGESPGVVCMTLGHDTVNHVVALGENAPPEASTQQVSMTTLDIALGQRVPIVVKIDVEGFETAVLAGSEATFARSGLQAALIESNGTGQRYGCTENAILSMMTNLGFRRCHYDPFKRRLEELQKQATSGGNMLFVRDLAFSRDRLRSAPAFQIHGRQI
jgi:FkbM family methyltransferase